MQELNLKTTLPALSFDAEALKAWALSLTEKYIGLVVTEDAVNDAKQDMAELNKAKKSLEDARKETVRQVSAPIKEFEEQIKKIVAIFDTAYKGLAAQVHTFEEKERESKAEKVRDIITQALEIRKSEIVAFPVPILASWLNKTTSLKSVREAVDDMINQRIQAEKAQHQAEQAQQERAIALEQAVKAANARHGITMSVAGFMVPRFTNIETPIDDALAAIEEVAQCAVESMKPKPEPVPVQSPHGVTPPAQKFNSEKTMSIIITFPLANASGVNLALSDLKKQCTSYNVRSR